MGADAHGYHQAWLRDVLAHGYHSMQKVHQMNVKQMKNQGFTLVELLVVVAIIAVIGAGIAVTYQRLDDKAKTAMEMSDIATLKKVVKHWGAINDYKIPNEMDSLVDDEGNLYSQMDDTTGTFTGYAPASSSGMGIYGPAGFTFVVETAPTNALRGLANAGMTLTYTHLVSAANANDSTFEAGMMGGSVDTSNTKSTLMLQAEQDALQDFVTAGVLGSYPGTAVNGETYADQPSHEAAIAEAQDVLDSPLTSKLAFIYPGGGAKMQMGPMMSVAAPMNVTDEIITNAGLKPEEVAIPGQSEEGKKYYLVAMGFGRFCSIYQGKAIRADSPATGKRQSKELGTYSRYIGIFRVPIIPYDSMTGEGQMAELVDVLSPQGYSVAALSDNYLADERKVRD